jgi:hypothetical protein
VVTELVRILNLIRDFAGGATLHNLKFYPTKGEIDWYPLERESDSSAVVTSTAPVSDGVTFSVDLRAPR